MKKEMKKILKRYLKKRRRVTEGLIVVFLVTGGIGYGEELEITTPGIVEIKENESYKKVVIKSDDVTLNVQGKIIAGENSDAADISNAGNAVYMEDVYTDVGINNVGTILGNINITAANSSISDSSGNGILTVDIGSNTGVIKGEVDLTTGDSSLNSISDLSLSGNGVYGSVGNNTGIIKGFVNAITGASSSYSYLTLYSSGNGVSGGISKNEGVVKGKVEAVTGNSTSFSSSFSESYSSSSTPLSGNGVYGDLGENKGVISGEANAATGDSSATASYSYSTSRFSSRISGNGVSGDIGENRGVIKGKVNISTGDSSNFNSSLRSFSYSGLSLNLSGNGTAGNIVKNSGMIKGKVNTTTGDSLNSEASSRSDSYLTLGSSGNGVYGDTESNRGIMTGNIKFKTGNYSVDGGNTWRKDYVSNYFSGNGLAYDQVFTKNFYNSGLAAGSESAVALKDAGSLTGSITNYGILAGREIIGDGTEVITNERPVNEISNYSTYGDLALLDLGTKYSNYGVEIKFNNDDDRTIATVNNGSGGLVTIDGEEFTILNTEIRGGADSYKEININTAYDNHIINGAGIDSGVLTINNSEITLNNSIVNGYEKAVTLNGNSTLNAANTTFNGGGIGRWDDNGTPDDNMDDILEYTNIIEGDNGDNIVHLSGNSIVNGDVDLGDGADIMSVSTGTQINGDIYGGNGTDRLNLGDNGGSLKTLRTTADNLNIYHKISGFEDISVKNQVTLYETARVEGAEKINIEANSSLNLRIDPTKKDGNERITGHPLYGSGAVITGAENTYEGIEGDTDGGALNIVTNGLGTGGIISMDTVTLDKNLYVRTNSIITKASVLDDGDVLVKAGQDLDEVKVPDTLKYDKLNLVYQSIKSSGDENFDALDPTANTSGKTADQAWEGLLLLLNEVFMANPYGYVSRTSKDSMGLFNEMVLNNPFRANEGNWMVYGGLTFGGDDYDSSYKDHIKGNYYGFDTYGVDINADSNVYGGYALAEYGLSKNTSVGFVLGGANSNTDISNGSEIDGDSIYVGGYAKSKINNFKLTAGLGYQYSNYDTTRIAGNKYQSNKYEEDLSTDGFSAYTGLSYDYALNSKWSLEPKLNLTYSRVTQGSVSEEGILSIEAEKESFNYIDTEIGMNLVRKISLDSGSGEGKFRLGLSYVYALEGSDADYVTGRFQGGSDFDILVPKRDNGIAKIKGSYDVEYKSGIIYSVGGAYLPGENRDEYYASIGIGFKFNNLKDFIPTKTNDRSNVKKEAKTLTVEEADDVKIEKQKTNAVITDNISGFNLNSSKLTGEMGKELDKAASEIQKKELAKVRVTGHTDSTGPEAFNKKLSLKRAEAAKSRLSKTLPEVEITTKGKGSDQPLESNDTLEGRRKNRRIEIGY